MELALCFFANRTLPDKDVCYSYKGMVLWQVAEAPTVYNTSSELLINTVSDGATKRRWYPSSIIHFKYTCTCIYWLYDVHAGL